MSFKLSEKEYDTTCHSCESLKSRNEEEESVVTTQKHSFQTATKVTTKALLDKETKLTLLRHLDTRRIFLPCYFYETITHLIVKRVHTFDVNLYEKLLYDVASLSNSRLHEEDSRSIMSMRKVISLLFELGVDACKNKCCDVDDIEEEAIVNGTKSFRSGENNNSKKEYGTTRPYNNGHQYDSSSVRYVDECSKRRNKFDDTDVELKMRIKNHVFFGSRRRYSSRWTRRFNDLKLYGGTFLYTIKEEEWVTSNKDTITKLYFFLSLYYYSTQYHHRETHLLFIYMYANVRKKLWGKTWYSLGREL